MLRRLGPLAFNIGIATVWFYFSVSSGPFRQSVCRQFSVPRSWNNKNRGFIPKLPNKLPQQFYFKLIAQKVRQYFGYFCNKKFVAKAFKIIPIWSHWSSSTVRWNYFYFTFSVTSPIFGPRRPSKEESSLAALQAPQPSGSGSIRPAKDLEKEAEKVPKQCKIIYLYNMF